MPAHLKDNPKNIDNFARRRDYSRPLFVFKLRNYAD